MARTYRDALEARYEYEMEGDSQMLPWMVKHAGVVISRYRVGTDGRTARERLTGKRCRREQVEFGECVMYLKPGTKGKYRGDSRWGGRRIPGDGGKF